MRKYWAYRVVETLANMMPLAVAYALAIAAVHVMLVLSPGRFVGLSSNLTHVVGELPPRRLRALVRANARNLGRSWVDVLRMSRPSSCARRLDVEGLDHLNEALAGGRGVVMVASHLGPWDAGLVAFNAGTGTVAVLAEVVHPRRLFDHLRRGRARLGVSVIPIDVAAMRAADADVARRIGAGAMRQVFGVLRGNGTVAIAIDRDLTGAGVALPFFGEPTPIPLGVVDIAIRCNSALVPAWSVRHGGRLCLSAMPQIPYDATALRGAEVQRVARTVLAAFEPVIKKNADQWHVLDPIWPVRALVRTRFSRLRHAPLLIALFCADRRGHERLGARPHLVHHVAGLVDPAGCRLRSRCHGAAGAPSSRPLGALQPHSLPRRRGTRRHDAHHRSAGDRPQRGARRRTAPLNTWRLTVERAARA